MFCSNCGKAMEDDARFCSGCGKSLGELGVSTPVPFGETPKKKSGKKGLAVFCIILALALVGGLIGVGYYYVTNSPERKYAQAMASAEELFEEEEYKDAITAYEEALEYQEGAEDVLEGISKAYVKLANKAMKKEEFEKAASCYEKAFADVENEDAMEGALDCYEEVAMSYLYSGNDAKFEKWLKKYEELAEEMGIESSTFLDLVYGISYGDEPVVVEDRTINVWAYTDEVPQMINRYVELHPEFPYEINTTIIATTDGSYQPALDAALQHGGEDAPDIYCVESAFALEYTQGDASSFAAPYADLGIDVDNKIREAQIADYSVQIGSRPSDGQVVALGYEGTGGAFIYRRSIAIDTWGTDDPAVISQMIGGGTGNWDQFLVAAEELKQKGYAIISGDGDIWHAVENSASQGWIMDGKLNIDPKREKFLDIAKLLKDNNYHNNTQDWNDFWFADMKGEGEKEVLGYFGPAWLINYTLEPNSGGYTLGEGTYGDWAVCDSPVGFFWGGTWILANKDSQVKEAVGEIIEWITLDCTTDGLQYLWANGTLWDDSYYYLPAKNVVTSATVMQMSNGEQDFLGGQNMFDVYIRANAFANGKNINPYDEEINIYWRDAVREYTEGYVERDDAIESFKRGVAEQLGIEVE